jgi:hypothetical protein
MALEEDKIKPGFILDVTIYAPNSRPQAKYLVHGYDDVMWTDSIDDVLTYIKQDLERIQW